MRRLFTTLTCVVSLSAAAFGPAAHADEIEAGKLKARSCAVCHGLEGISLNPIAPNLAGQPRMYLVEQLKAYRSGKRENALMGVISKPLSDQDISELSSWYASNLIELKK
jgi:cytochrome c553